MKHFFNEPLRKGQESVCKQCGLRVTPLFRLSYFEYRTTSGKYGDTKYGSLPKCRRPKERSLEIKDILSFLSQKYIVGKYVCDQALISPIKWQNVKRGYVHNFTPEETVRIKAVLVNRQLVIELILRQSSDQTLSDLLNTNFLYLRPLLRQHGGNHVNYDRICRFKRGEAFLRGGEHQLLKTALLKVNKELLTVITNGTMKLQKPNPSRPEVADVMV